MAGHRRSVESERHYGQLRPVGAGVAPRRPPRSRWKLPLIGGVAALFMLSGGIAMAATTTDPPQVNCELLVPDAPLSAQGLAQPYQLAPPCTESDPGQSAFVQATIIDTDTGKLSVYDPLVIDLGTKPAIAPTPPKLPAHAVVGIWFGFNGDNLTLAETDGGNALGKGNCVNGLTGSIFGQFAYCNADRFFAAANDAVAAGKLTIPDIGTGKDGQPCPTTRDFGMVDQDQSDNVTTTYLFLKNGTVAQNTAANQAKLAKQGAQVQANGSDEGLLSDFLQPTLGCTPFTAPDLADGGKPATSLALNELQAAAHQAQPVAQVPTNDPMTQVDGKANTQKTDIYRAGVDMPTIDPKVETPQAYCQNLFTIGIERTKLDKSLTEKVTSPDAGAATNLFTFLGQRLAGSFDDLNCGKLLHTKNPVKVTTNGDGVATNVTFGRIAGGPVTPPASASPSSAAPAPSKSVTPPTKSTTRPAKTPPTKSTTTAAAPPPNTSTTSPAAPPPPTTETTSTGAPQVVQQPAPGTNGGGTTGGGATGGGTTGGGAVSNGNTGGTTTGGGSNDGTTNGGGTNAGGTGTTGNTGTGTTNGGAAIAGGTDPTALPTLTLGPMARAADGGAGGGGTTGSEKMPQFAGTALLVAGGVLAIGIVLHTVMSARRRRRDAFDEEEFGMM